MPVLSAFLRWLIGRTGRIGPILGFFDFGARGIPRRAGGMVSLPVGLQPNAMAGCTRGGSGVHCRPELSREFRFMSFLAFLIAAVVLALTPGPGIAYVVA